MKLMVCGSRSITEKAKIFETLNHYLSEQDLLIISGGAKGVDSIAEE